jgi:hypothetical protein
VTTTTTTRRDDFRGPELDRAVWFPYYLPHWSSREATALAAEFVDEGLRVLIPTDHPYWCPDTHELPLRVSGFASGSRSGPVGSTDGPQSFATGLTVRQAQPHFEGWLLREGHLEIRCRMSISHRSMAALWLAGFEDAPSRSGEICVVEIFGKDAAAGSAAVGVGHKQLGDPALTHDFDAPHVGIDISEMHTYAVDWDAASSVFSVDGAVIARASAPPTYPMQIMVGVFDFPTWSAGGDDELVPELVIAHIAGTAEAPPSAR